MRCSANESWCTYSEISSYKLFVRPYGRVQPLMKRDHYGYEYTGSDDNSRFTTEEISDELVMQ